MITVREQSERFLAALETRRRNPVKSATLKAYRSYLRTWIVPKLGTLEVAAVENGILKGFVDYLVRRRLSPATIAGIVATLKSLVGSEIDANGNRVNPRAWNNAFVDAPPVDPSAQETPIITARELNAALARSVAPYTQFYVLGASTGLRMSETMALRMGPDTGTGSFMDLDKMTLFVRSAISHQRQEQSTKSVAGVREVDLHHSVVTWLRDKFPERKQGEYLFQSAVGGPWHITTLYDHTKQDGIPGTHSLRRFRTTHLENMSVPRVLVDYWTGHAGKAITDRYTKLGRSIDARRKWCAHAGIGFHLPGTTEDVIVDLYGEPELEEVL